MFVDCQNKKSRSLPAAVPPNNVPKICNIFLSIYFSSVSILFNPPREYCQYCVLFPGSVHAGAHRRTFLLAMRHKDNIIKDNEHMEVNSAFTGLRVYLLKYKKCVPIANEYSSAKLFSYHNKKMLY